MRICQIDGCGGSVTARGWCNPHYRRWLTTGDPLTPDGRKNPQRTPEHKEAVRQALIAYNKSRAGVPLSAERRQKMREARLGARHSPETRAKIGTAQRNERGNNWKGDDVGYVGLHDWMSKNKPRTGICEHCGDVPTVRGRTVGTEFANVSGEYRRDITDFIELCIPCHRKFDSPRRRKNAS